jgi:HEAT repeat protein
MKMPSFFCPHCWKEIGDHADRCAHCGYDLEKYRNLSYEKKLVNALHHPIRENRMMAAQLLGEIKSKEALAAFKEIIETQDDYYFIKEILLALKKIGGAESRALIERIKSHQSKLIRRAAKHLAGNESADF